MPCMIISTYQLVITISLNSIQAEDGDFQFKLRVEKCEAAFKNNKGSRKCPLQIRSVPPGAGSGGSQQTHAGAEHMVEALLCPRASHRCPGKLSVTEIYDKKTGAATARCMQIMHSGHNRAI
ncbi:hypothetical protein E2C01_019592 [Portunus trituberculatus]|uniref:Uncharacterized protein n=1 Tax=Portunus trituberculatus TaxID=210409 RepID=A0A5B7DZT2_PORTR|nr:hypothetical protein [Portunus trituberculatus]